jgi:hypothetical protein
MQTQYTRAPLENLVVIQLLKKLQYLKFCTLIRITPVQLPAQVKIRAWIC